MRHQVKCAINTFFLSGILVLAQKNKKWLSMWSVILSFKAGMTGNIFKLTNKQKKLLTTWGLNGKKKRASQFLQAQWLKIGMAIYSLHSPLNLLFENRAELLWVWPENKNPWGRQPELRSLACGCAQAQQWTNLTREFQETAQLISCANSLACFNAACDAGPVRCSSKMCLCAAKGRCVHDQVRWLMSFYWGSTICVLNLWGKIKCLRRQTAVKEEEEEEWVEKKLEVSQTHLLGSSILFKMLLPVGSSRHVTKARVMCESWAKL